MFCFMGSSRQSVLVISPVYPKSLYMYLFCVLYVGAYSFVNSTNQPQLANSTIFKRFVFDLITLLTKLNIFSSGWNNIKLIEIVLIIFCSMLSFKSLSYCYLFFYLLTRYKQPYFIAENHSSIRNMQIYFFNNFLEVSW